VERAAAGGRSRAGRGAAIVDAHGQADQCRIPERGLDPAHQHHEPGARSGSGCATRAGRARSSYKHASGAADRATASGARCGSPDAGSGCRGEKAAAEAACCGASSDCTCGGCADACTCTGGLERMILSIAGAAR
jgi:hypothetical protein